MKLTVASVKSLILSPGEIERKVFDEDIPGFGLRIRVGGSRTWIVQYKIGVKHRRMTLGSVMALDLGKARDTAKDLLAAVRLGRDPAGEKLSARTKAGETFGSLLPRYLAQKKLKLKPRSYDEVERHLMATLRPLHTSPIEAIDRRVVAARLAIVAVERGPVAANRTRASLSAYCAWLVREGLSERNPVIDTNKAPESAGRERLLADAELAEIWRALGSDQYASIVKLLLLTGARRDEIANLRWSEVDLDGALITLPGERTKNNRPHEIPLTGSALAILADQPHRSTADDSGPRDLIFGYGDGGFQLWSASKENLDKRIIENSREAMAGWVLHDFRRALSTTMHERLGIQPHIVEAILGHVSGHRRGVAGTYNKSLYRTEKRRALEIWAEHVLAIAAGRMSNIISLPRA